MKCLALSLCLLVSLFAATPAVTINGTVTDIKGKALAGVGVSLALSGSKTTTDASGAWSLDWPTAGVSGHTEILSAPRWSGKAVELTLASVSEVTVDAFTLSGALLRRTKVGHLEAGYHSIPLPAPSAGLTWLRVTVNGHSESLLAGMGRSAGGRTSGIGAGRAMAFPDTLVFTWKSKVTARRLLTVIPSAAITVVVDTGEIPWQTGITYGSVSDSVGRIYRTVQIGDQTWMAENLNYKGVGKDTIGACFYDSTQYCQIYGRLYSWAEVMRISKK